MKIEERVTSAGLIRPDRFEVTIEADGNGDGARAWESTIRLKRAIQKELEAIAEDSYSEM
ncbi:hypothetical protein HUG10_21235 (plasmid) [Halorarum halophilum]|uniref:Uncharacterized protein n=1 Tax=Halorarum halophilum TaxID=2743090 RepID=A0A7D5H484_9EURY|nr:hypothetical protein [Halobaculum halophilum]QLG30113.1 hypothetical protein HUG10_21235 [Halobaculum halophilum]